MNSLRQTRRYVSRGLMTEARDRKGNTTIWHFRLLTSGFWV